MPGFAVVPGSKAHPNQEAATGAGLHKPAQIALAHPVEAPLDLFMVIPEHVGSDDVDACRLYLREFALPLGSRVAGVMELAHDRQPGLSFERKVAGVDSDRPSRWRAPSGFEWQCGGRRDGAARVDTDQVRRSAFSGPEQ